MLGTNTKDVVLEDTRKLREMDNIFDAEWFPVEPTKQPVVHPRSGHATWWCQGTLYAYGGNDVDCTNEVVSCSDGVNWEVKRTQGIPPIGTFGHSLCFFEDRQTVFIYGGTQMEGVAAAVHYLDMTPGPTFLSWKSISYRSPPNVALDRWGASAIPYKDGLVILFGGADDKDTHYDDVIFYNMAKEEFELISQIPDIGRPPPRRRHGAVLYDGRIMFIAGGRDQSCFRNDLWAFQLPTKTWTLINCTVTPYDLAVSTVFSSSPSGSFCSFHPRTGLSMVLRGHRLYVLMGYSDGPPMMYNDIHEFDLLTCQWRCLTIGGHTHPSKRSMASVDICPSTGDLILFGGRHNHALGDTWRLRFHPDKSGPSLRDLCVWSLRRLGSPFSPSLKAVLENAPSHILQELIRGRFKKDLMEV